MLSKPVELMPQAPQATTDIHRIALGLESGLSDQCIYSLCCLDTCIIEGLVNPVKDEGLWNKCESCLVRLLRVSASGPLLLHTLHTLSLSIQLSMPSSDKLVERMLEIVLSPDNFSLKERMLALRCLSVMDLDDIETKEVGRALELVLRFGCESESEFLTLAISLLCRFVNSFSISSLNETVTPNLLFRMKGLRGSSKMLLACLGVLHYILESKPDVISVELLPEIADALISRLVKGGCDCSLSCESCQACLSCLLRIGVHPVLRESLRPFLNVLIEVSFGWKSGSPVAAQSLLNMMASLIH